MEVKRSLFEEIKEGFEALKTIRPKELTVRINPLELDDCLRPDIIVVDRMRAAGIPVIGLDVYQGVDYGRLYSKIEKNGDISYLWSDK